MADNLNEVNTEETKSVTLPSYYENAPYEDKTVESVEEKAEENREKEEKKDNSDDAFKNMLTKSGRPKNTFFAILSFIFGIASVAVGFFSMWGIAVAVLAIGFSLLSRNSLGYFHPLSIAGISLGVVGVVIPIALVLLAPIITALYT